MTRDGAHLQPSAPGAHDICYGTHRRCLWAGSGICARPRAGEGLTTAASADLCHEAAHLPAPA